MAETADALRTLGLAVTVVGPDATDPDPGTSQVLVLPSSMLDPAGADQRPSPGRRSRVDPGPATRQRRLPRPAPRAGPHRLLGLPAAALAGERAGERLPRRAGPGGSAAAAARSRGPARTGHHGRRAARRRARGARRPGHVARLTGRMVALDTRDLSTESHQLTRQPQCPPAATRTSSARPSHGSTCHRAAPSPVGPVSPAPGTPPRRTPRSLTTSAGTWGGEPADPAGGDRQRVTHTYSAGHNFAQPASSPRYAATCAGRAAARAGPTCRPG
ncbi:hypothetical protein NKG94_01900 [Micromonospora sp. M12]